MARSTTLATASEQAVVVKRASGPDAAALEAEGDRLRAAAHPGVVEVVSSVGSDREWELTLLHAGRPLSAVGTLSVEQVAGTAAAVAATLADLHDAGIVHGRIDATHVLIGPHGRPVLCGFGGGAQPASPGDDVAALGTLIGELLSGTEELEPIPERRWRRRPHWSGWTRRSLLTIADQACAEPATRRPTARRLAAAIAEVVPDAVTPVASMPMSAAGIVSSSPASTTDDDDPLHLLRRTAQYDGGSRWPVSAIACAVVGAALLAVGGLQLSGGTPSSRAADPMAASAAGPVTSVRAASSVTSVPSSAQVDGNVVLYGAHRFEVGEPGDVVVVGDWDCDGTATPAVLRPASGEVFVFPSWTSDEDVVVRAQAVVEGAVDLLAEPSAGGDLGCGALVAERADASRVPVKVGRS
jgi:hypothetical protein